MWSYLNTWPNRTTFAKQTGKKNLGYRYNLQCLTFLGPAPIFRVKKIKNRQKRKRQFNIDTLHTNKKYIWLGVVKRS